MKQEEEYLRKRYSSSNIRFKTIIDSLFNNKTEDFKNFKTKIKLDKTSRINNRKCYFSSPTFSYRKLYFNK